MRTQYNTENDICQVSEPLYTTINLSHVLYMSLEGDEGGGMGMKAV